MERKYTWKPDIPDFRDYKFSKMSTSSLTTDIPNRVDLRANYDRVFDQGNLGSCTANAISLAFDFELIKQGKKPITPSRLFIYYNERAIENTINEDSGAMIRDGIKSLAKIGVCKELLWPYNINRFTVKPKLSCYITAVLHKINQYIRLDNRDINQLKTNLAQGYGFVFGFSVYESFESTEVATTGVVPMPKSNEKLLGGHAVYCLGYDDGIQSFIVRNSWGADWGDGGHFYIPYSYLTDTDLADDFWTIRKI